MRANFITSVDGGATADGTSWHPGWARRPAIFNLLRELADVIVVGAGTVRVEGYSGAQMGVAQRQRRQARGQSEVPQLAIVTKSGRLDRDLGVFTRTEVAPLVLTCTAAADETRRLLGDLAEVVDCSGERPRRRRRGRPAGDPASPRACAASSPRAARRCSARSCERDMLDELCLTIAPYLVGGMARRITDGTRPAADPHALCARPDRRRRLPVHALREVRPVTMRPAKRREVGAPPAREAASGQGGQSRLGRSGMATVVGMSRHIRSAAILVAVTMLVGRLRPGPGRRPALRHQLRRPTTRRGQHEAAAQRSAADRRAQERFVVARLHVSGFRGRGRASRGRRPAGLRELRRRPRPATAAPEP